VLGFGTELDPRRVTAGHAIQAPAGSIRSRQDTKKAAIEFSTISEIVCRRLDTAGSQFPADQRNRGSVTVSVVGRCEITRQEWVARQRPKPAAALDRTVRPGVQTPRLPIRGKEQSNVRARHLLLALGRRLAVDNPVVSTALISSQVGSSCVHAV
jgi:hypothetical protein